MLKTEILNSVKKRGVFREIRITPHNVEVNTILTESNTRITCQYKYIMYDNASRDIFTILTCKGQTVVFNIKLCKSIIYKPRVVHVQSCQVGKEIFIKVVDKQKHAIYDEKGNLLEQSTECNLEVTFGGEKPIIKSVHRGTKKIETIELR